MVRNGATTKELIYEAALDAFAENGYAGASLRDIARRVGIEVASLYNHIRSKEELLYRIIRQTSIELIDEIDAAVAAAPDNDPREQLLRAVACNVEYHATHPRHSFIGNVELRSMTEAHEREALDLRSAVEDRFKRLVEACMAAGYLPAETSVTVTAYHLIAIGTSVPRWYREDGKMKPSDVAAVATELIRNGLDRRRKSVTR